MIPVTFERFWFMRIQLYGHGSHRTPLGDIWTKYERHAWRLISWKFYGNLRVNISLRFILKFLSFTGYWGRNSSEMHFQFFGNSKEISMEILWKFCRNSTEIPQKVYGSSKEMVALILQLHGYLEAHSMDILWMFVSSYCLEICIENLIIYRLLGAKFLGNSFTIP